MQRASGGNEDEDEVADEGADKDDNKDRNEEGNKVGDVDKNTIVEIGNRQQ